VTLTAGIKPALKFTWSQSTDIHQTRGNTDYAFSPSQLWSISRTTRSIISSSEHPSCKAKSLSIWSSSASVWMVYRLKLLHPDIRRYRQRFLLSHHTILRFVGATGIAVTVADCVIVSLIGSDHALRVAVAVPARTTT
jgi:hypothetical protein